MSSQQSSDLAACALEGGGTSRRQRGPLAGRQRTRQESESLVKLPRSPSSVLEQMSSEESRLMRLPSSSVPSMQVLLKILNLSLKVALEALVLEVVWACRMQVPCTDGCGGREPMPWLLPRSLRKRMPPMQSPGRRGFTADGYTSLPHLSFATCPQPRQLWHRISPLSKADSLEVLNIAKSVAS
eukprot:2359649-Pleurochrysis_carterae.AAC.2